MNLLSCRTLLSAALLVLVPTVGLADDDRNDDYDDDDEEVVLIQRLPDRMYEMIQARFDGRPIDIQRAVLEIEDEDEDDIEFEVILVHDGKRYEVEFEPGDTSIDDDDIELLDDDANPDTNDHYDDDQNR